jgi:hypothetical protein
VTAPAKKRKPRKVVAWIIVDADGDVRELAMDERDAIRRIKWAPLWRVVRCEGVLK